MVGQNPAFESEKQIFPGSAQKCPESINFDVKLANSRRIAKIKFLGAKSRFPRIGQKGPESTDFEVNLANSGRVAKIQFLGPKSRFPQDRPKSVQNRWILT